MNAEALTPILESTMAIPEYQALSDPAKEKDIKQEDT